MNTFFLAFVLFAGVAYGQGTIDCGACQAQIGPMLAEAVTPDAISDVVGDVSAETCDIPAEADQCKADIVEAWTEVANALTGSGKVQTYICQNTVCGPDGATKDLSCDECKSSIADLGAQMKDVADDVDKSATPEDDAIADADEKEIDALKDADVDKADTDNVTDDDVKTADADAAADNALDDKDVAEVDADADADPENDATAADGAEIDKTVAADDAELDKVKDAEWDAMAKKKSLTPDDIKTLDADGAEIKKAAQDCPDTDDDCVDGGALWDTLEFLQGEGYCAADPNTSDDDVADCADAVEDAFPAVIELLAVKLVDNADAACAAIKVC